MEHSYKAYIKTINNTEYYFVKKYSCFPEFKNVPAILQNYGMHTSFNKACKIAEIHDNDLKQRLFNEASQGSTYGYNKLKPALSTSLRVEIINNKPSIVTKLTGIKKIISDRMPHWRILSHS